MSYLSGSVDETSDLSLSIRAADPNLDFRNAEKEEKNDE
jgi:hypothetical protein